ncbi:RDD family protein [Algicella marina]|uniref:RDD family protein n=1 Tax=Algicella marina TaxID=2683284 RepID=A0A6P1ST86_9RHOB|nr:RDD family protein [Algicella marina]QHQ33884.1 RDD family protein [Algicella marina]
MSRKPDSRKRPPVPKTRMTEILPPEGVPIRFDLAGLGGRFGAQLVDILLSLLVVSLFIFVLSAADVITGEGVIAILALSMFLLRAPYYITTEILWNGQTLGKRLLGLRVVSGDGRALSPHAITVRNLMKEFEVFVPGTYLLIASNLGIVPGLILLVWIIALLLIPLFNKRRQRLGDIIANTYVISVPRPVLLPDLTRQPTPAAGQFTFLPHHLDHYGRFELQTLEQLLQVRTGTLNAAARRQHDLNLRRVSDAIVARIGFEENIPEADTDAFLRAFYRTQRAYLENRKLFGDTREDKFHNRSETRA